jgi:hypothetical protein
VQSRLDLQAYTMTSTTKIRYFPTIEVLTVSVLTSAAVALFYFSNANLLWLIPIVPHVYIITMGRATIVQLDHECLNITSLSIFLKSGQINLRSAVRIELHQTMERITDVTYGGSFFAYDKYYELEYNNKEGEISKIYFSINNRMKEEKIISNVSLFLRRY